MSAVGPRLWPLLDRLGFRAEDTYGTALSIRRTPQARRHGRRHAQRHTHNTGQHQQHWKTLLHLGGHKRSWHEALQQIRIKLLGVRVHLADYVERPNQHLRSTFLHPEVQACGCTRIEDPLLQLGPHSQHSRRGCERKEALALVSPKDLPEKRGLVCGPKPRKVLGQPGRLLRLVSCPKGRFCRLVCTPENGQVFGSLDLSSQGQRGQ